MGGGCFLCIIYKYIRKNMNKDIILEVQDIVINGDTNG